MTLRELENQPGACPTNRQRMGFYMTTLTKTRAYKGYCIVDSYRTIYSRRLLLRLVRAYIIDTIDSRTFSTIKQAKSYIDYHLPACW